MRSPRRTPKEVDWQAELAARQGGGAGQIEAAGSATASDTSSGRAMPVLWRGVRLLVGAVGLAAVIVGRHHLAGLILIGAWVALWPLDWWAVRRSQRERRRSEGEDLEPTPEERIRNELHLASYDLRWFLINQTERRTYENWLRKTDRALEKVSPEVARRWIRSDGSSDATSQWVTAVELVSRRRRLLELYSEVATPEKLEILKASLPQAPSARAITNS